jgi:acyl transferase domain-containing protein/NADPH:quinone reductase-like Zn-dependent oxidoreductase/SAM-dependent methyltransferase
MSHTNPLSSLSPLKRALLAVEDLKARLEAAEGRRQEPIAVVGLGCRMPGAEDPEAYWRLLRDGGCPLRETPADRWDVDEYYDPDPDAPGKMCTRVGAYLERVDLFDPQFFGIAPREATTMDPQQRLLLEVCWEALEHAGIAPDTLSGTSTGVFFGVAASDYLEIAKGGDLTRIDPHFASGVAHSIASGRVAYVLGLQGPAVTVDTACSSSLVSVHLAVQSLLTRDCRMALAGGVNLILKPDNGVVFSKTRMLSPDGRSKAFDAAADGFGRGEGCGVVVLKRLSDARADGDRVLAVIPGSAANQDGPSSGLTAPNGPAQEAVVRAALLRAGLVPDEVDWIETHGTGTSLGDPIEIRALGSVFSPRQGAPLAVASVKTNIGHLEAAAGVAGLIKIVLAIQHEAVPPHLHLQRLNPLIDWDDLPIEVPTSLRAWPRGPRVRTAGVSSFGFSGTNVHVLVQEAPADAEAAPGLAVVGERPQHVISVSARSDAALDARLAQLADHLAGPGADLPLADTAFTANAGRAQFACRAVVRASSTAEAREQLAALRDGNAGRQALRGRRQGPEAPKVGLLFTGQGAQYAGMARSLYETQPEFRRVLDACDSILRGHLERPLLSVLYGSSDDTRLIDQTAYTQPAMFAVDYALAELWRSWGVVPAAVMGHSLGEFVAACVAGVMPLEDALALVATRGRLMQALPPDGAMASVFAAEAIVERAVRSCSDRVSVAAVNDPAQTVISGQREAVEDLLAQFAASGVKTARLTVSHAFHSPLMAPMLDEFAAAAERVRFSAARIPIVSNVTGRVAGGEVATAAYWRRHVLAPVRFAESVVAMHERGIQLFVEAGPHATLLGMAARCLPGAAVEWIPSLRNGQDDWAQVLDGLCRLYVEGGRVDWAGFDRGYRRRRVALPTYPFERERYWVNESPSVPRPSLSGDRHPLLGHRVHVAGVDDLVFEASLSPATHPWVYDHRVRGTAILPGTGFFELAFAAAAELWGQGAHGVREAAIHAPLVLADERATTVQVVVADRGTSEASVRVFSASADEVPRWDLHAEGTLTRDGVPGAAGADFDAIRGRCRPADPAVLYEALVARGIELGPAFHAVRELHRADGEALARVALPEQAGDAAPFQVHPVLLDNALQTAGAALLARDAHATFLPAGLDRGDVIGRPGRAAWAHAVVRRADAGAEVLTADVSLFDDDGRPLAVLSGLHFKRADVRALGGALVLPEWLYETTWDPQSRDGAAPAFPATADVAAAIEAHSGQAAAAHGVALYDEALPQMEALSAEYVANGLLTLGWQPAPGERVAPGPLAIALGIVEAQRRLVGRLLEILAETGHLRADGGEYVVVRPPVLTDTAARMAGLRARYAEALGPELDMLEAAGPHLAEVLSGRADPLALLFPAGSAERAEALYERSRGGRAFNQLLAHGVERLLASVPAAARLAVLEIGGGTGSASSFVLPVLPAQRTRYTFTDVSPVFTTRAARKFAEYPFVEYRTLDIERDPVAQGLPAQGFDVVIAGNVLHATKNLTETFSHVRLLLKPGGQLLMLEINRRQRWIDLTFGLTDGWWRFEDLSLRPSYPLLDRDAWQLFLEREGFTEVMSSPAPGTGLYGLQAVVLARAPRAAGDAARGRWLVLGDAAGTGRRVAQALAARGGTCEVLDAPAEMSVPRGVERLAGGEGWRGVVHLWSLDPMPGPTTAEALDRFEQHALGSALDLAKTLVAGTPPPGGLTLVTRAAQPVERGDVVAAHQAPLWGFAKSVALEHPDLRCRAVDIDASDAAVEELVEELTAGGVEPQVAFRGGRRYVARLARHDGTRRQRPPAEYRLDTTSRGTMEALALVRSVRRAPAAGEVEIAVRATALNFADVMDALGVRPGGAAAFGGECGGRIVAVGPGVTGLEPGDEVVAIAEGSYATHVTCPASLVAKKPAALALEQAVTLPIAFITARYSLEDVAGLRAGESVLIHAAAGGVGLAAVQVAHRIGATVFATAGSPRKRAYLKSLGVEDVFSSRDADFADAILRQTNGRGVDVALNCLTGDLIPATFRSVAPSGRFVEIGKTGWSAAQAAAARGDVRFVTVDWAPMARSAPARIRAILDEVIAGAEAGTYRPLPVARFQAVEAIDALRYMAQARHIGKVVALHEAPDVRADATYLVTGGLSGLGLLTAGWLVERGAGCVVLVGRSEPTVQAREVLAGFERAGARVVVERADVTRDDDLDRVFERLRLLPPLRGIIHSAGVLDDGVLDQQDWPRFERVLGPKVAGAWRLHERSLAHPVDFFVLFSSVAAIFGAAAQASHSAANGFLDALAHARRAEGLPATSINWGAWAEVGAAVRHGVDRRVGEQGVGTIAPARGLAALDLVIREQTVQVAVFPVNWARYAERFADREVPPFLSGLVAPPRHSERRPGRRADDEAEVPDLLRRLADTPEDGRARVVLEFVRDQALKTLGQPRSRAIDVRQPLHEVGLDSLMAVELRNSLAASLRRPLPSTLLFDYPTIEALAGYLGGELLGAAGATDAVPAESASPAPRGVMTGDVVNRLEDLSDDEVERLLAERMARGKGEGTR